MPTFDFSVHAYVGGSGHIGLDRGMLPAVAPNHSFNHWWLITHSSIILNRTFVRMRMFSCKLLCLSSAGSPPPFSKQELTHWKWDKMATILQMTLWNAFPGMEIFVLRLKKSLQFVRKVSINNQPTLFQIMAWRRTDDKPLSEPMMVQFTDAY